MVDITRLHYNDVIMGTIASQITTLMIVYSTVYSDADQRKSQSSAPLAFLRGIHRRPVNSPHKWPVPRKMFPFDDVIIVMLGVLLFIMESTLDNQRINSSLPRRNGCHFADDVFKYIFLNDSSWFWLKIHWSLFPRVQLPIFQHCFR